MALTLSSNEDAVVSQVIVVTNLSASTNPMALTKVTNRDQKKSPSSSTFTSRQDFILRTPTSNPQKMRA